MNFSIASYKKKLCVVTSWSWLVCPGHLKSFEFPAKNFFRETKAVRPLSVENHITSPKNLCLIEFLLDGLGVAAVGAAQDGLLAVDGVGAPSRCVAAEGASLPGAVPAMLFAEY